MHVVLLFGKQWDLLQFASASMLTPFSIKTKPTKPAQCAIKSYVSLSVEAFVWGTGGG